MKAKQSSLLLVIVCFFSFEMSNAYAKCSGKFVNPITDVCWECIFPISIGDIKSGGNNPDTKNPKNPICSCPTPFPRVGISVGFWEPVRMVDVTRNAYCFPSLGGLKMDLGVNRGNGSNPTATQHHAAFWHVHWYVYPLIHWLELLMDFACLENSAFDLAYITELDPLWQDSSLTFIINPEAALFANHAALVACAADCGASTFEKSMDKLFWCAGCQGSMYPASGYASYASPIQSSLLALEKFTFKLHRELIEWGSSGQQAQCSRYPMPIMKKSQYRSQLTVPVPSDCYPFGKSTALYSAGKVVPVTGEDFGYLVWRKRNCCAF